VPSKIRIGLSLSITGRYAAMGRQAEAALRLFTSDTNSAGGIRVGGESHEVSLECLDDTSDPTRCAEIYRSLCDGNRSDIILGPYSSELARVAAPIAEQASMVFVNHGGAADDLYTHRYRMIVGVLSPASDYFNGFVRLVAGLKLWRKRVAVIRSATGFAEAVARGIERESENRYARRKGVRVRVKYAGKLDPESAKKIFAALRRNRINVLVSAGSYDHDLAVMRAVIKSDLNIPVLACVAAGVEKFHVDLGDDGEGIVGPSQWEDQLKIEPEIGPTPRQFSSRMRVQAPTVTCDYPAAQAYAAGVLTKVAIENADSLDSAKIREAFSDLRTTTFFGDFSIDRVTGRQLGHRVLIVQWHGGHKVVIDPESHVETGTLEFPSGWRLILASLQGLKLTRRIDEESRDNNDKE
jgi:branched-chain amino acid transport system substrate-binding protein